MPSKQVTDRQKSADAVCMAADVHAERVNAALSTLLSPHLAQASGETIPDVAVLMRLFSRALRATKEQMIKADEAHEAELGDDEPARKARDQAFEELYAELVTQREVLTGLYGAAVAAQVMPSETPRDPVVLARFSRTVEKNLAEIPLPASRVKGATLNAADVKATLTGMREALEARIETVSREVREAQTTQVAKRQSMDSYDGMFGGVAGLLSHLLLVAGERDLATQVKPSARRPGQTAIQADEKPEPSESQTTG
ncbi:hypothetical protein [Polyangium sp. 15x6]|uniref:hypothetical protein n=1 Tax=Polyangium sp. 15x6 TaxID=3042687 RepID=UPI00249B3BC5|nr:hypothetical protein [Polyangium sp. 15x6]MDI3290754.1 hypothetical protein [Polyangium sp. 15x6]